MQAILGRAPGAVVRAERVSVTALLSLLLLAPSANAQSDIVPPEIVRLESVRVRDEVKLVTMGNTNKHYSLFCNVKADGCITPERGKNYLLFNAKTRWKMPGVKDFMTLAFVQDWIGGGYEQDTVATDGPIIYGTGMSDENRRKAWKHLWMQMVEAVVREQGKDALGVQLAERCSEGEDVCTTALDANFVGIGGIQEPRQVVVIVAHAPHEPSKQLLRAVCTWPAKDKRVCRDFDTGKLITDEQDQ
jgi:hypothetical protein